MIALDTTVLVYAKGGEHPLARPARLLMESIAQGRVRATTTVEVIQEFVHVRSRRRSRGEATAQARELARGLAPLWTTETAELEEGLDLFARVATLGAFDAVLAATARARGAEALVSADRAFAEVAGLALVPLGGAELRDLIRRDA